MGERMESKSHSQLKEKADQKYEKKEYETESEHRVENGLIVDVKAENDVEKVFIETGTMHGEDRAEKLESYCDKLVHLPQIDKPNTRGDRDTTVSFKKDFIEQVEGHLADSNFSSTRMFPKHPAMKEIGSKEDYSNKEVQKIAQKLDKLEYLDR